MLQVKLVSLSLLAIIFCHSDRLYAADDIDKDPAIDTNLNSPINGEFQVTATIERGCEFDKGSYELPLTEFNANTASSKPLAITLSCTLSENLQLTVDEGKNWSKGSRRLINENGKFINYTVNISDKPSGGGTTVLNHQFTDSIDYQFFLKATADISNAQAGNYQDTLTLILTM